MAMIRQKNGFKFKKKEHFVQTDKKNKARVQNEDGNLDFKLKRSEEIKEKLFKWKNFSIFLKLKIQ